MREERGQVAGDVVVTETFELWGTIGGNVTVATGGKLYLRGAVYGNLMVEKGGRVHIFGQVHGNVHLAEQTKVIHGGMVGGNIVNDGGRLFLERGYKVVGKVKTRGGETKIEGVTPELPPERPDPPERQPHSLS
jgi:cytoskeletal protein CcmA (bactofilin family)